MLISLAQPEDAAGIAALRKAAALELTAEYGTGHWSSEGSEEIVLRNLTHAKVLVGRTEDTIVATLRLASKKPWAIDPAYFTAVPRALYLTDMAVHPAIQGNGIGRRLLDAARETAVAWPADAIRLDAYDAPAGAGEFYSRCGYVERGRVVYRSVPLIYFELILQPLMV